MITGEKKFQGLEVMEEILDVPVIEDALQAEARNLLQLQGIGAGNVIATVGSLWAGVFGMKEAQQHTARLHHAVDALHQRFHQELGEIIGDAPEQHSIELLSAKDEVLGEEALYIHGGGAIFPGTQQRRIHGRQQNIHVVDLVSE